MSKDWVIIGRFGRPYGVHGAITVRSFTEPVGNILNYAPWYGLINHQWQRIQVASVLPHADKIRVNIAEYVSREAVATLTNVSIAVPREELPALQSGEYYCHDLIGMRVITREQVLLGTVIDVMSTGSNDVLVIQGEKRHLVPYIMEDVILTIDPEKRSISVDWDPNF